MPDQEGKEFADLEGAIANAVAEAIEMMKASLSEQMTINLHHSISVRDEAGAVVHTVRYKDAIRIVD